MVLSGFRLDAEEGERLRFGEVEIVIKATAQTTGRAFSIFEENSPVNTPLLVHEHEDELFFVIEGEHVFRSGTKRSRLVPAGWSSPRAACPIRSVAWWSGQDACS
jgi:mannose-6-phosphate isomerase-like protein (cupin superfamily)